MATEIKNVSGKKWAQFYKVNTSCKTKWKNKNKKTMYQVKKKQVQFLQSKKQCRYIMPKLLQKCIKCANILLVWKI